MSEIQVALNSCGIKSNGFVSSKRWLGILCPISGHYDKHFGNCFINLDSGVIKCFACGGSSHISKFLKTNSQTFGFLQKLVEEKSKPVVNNSFTAPLKPTEFIMSSLMTVPLIPEKFIYTRSRGFTKEYCEEFNIRHCLSYPYMDYFLTPVIDTKKQINEIEARQLCRYEILKKYIDYNENSEKTIQECFNEYLKSLSDINQRKKEDSTLWYLLDTKVKYLPNSNLYQTLFNIDNLDYNKDLYVVEGLGSHPKIYCNISKNVTATFGSNLDELQIEELKKFTGKLYFISDNDKAAIKMFERIRFEFDNTENIRIIDIPVEDTDESYMDKIMACKGETIGEYLIKYYLHF